MKRGERAALKAVLTSDLTPDAMSLWTYLRFVQPGGAGKLALKRLFGASGLDWELGLEVLLELELVEQATVHNGGLVYKALVADVDPRAKPGDTPVALAETTSMIMERYQSWRESNGFRPWSPTPSDDRKMSKLLDWIRLHSVPLQEYMDFSLVLYKNISGVSCPSPSHLAGPYAQSHWLNRDTVGPSARAAHKRKTHAGSSFRPAKGIRRSMEKLGIETDGLDDAKVRWLDDLARAVREDPSTPVPVRWRSAVQALIGR